MKVQKMVSLDPETAKIAENMGNFSRFVRIALSMHAVGDSVEDERRKRRLWKRVSDALRLELVRTRRILGEEEDQATEKVDQILIDILAEARKQTELDVE